MVIFYFFTAFLSAALVLFQLGISFAVPQPTATQSLVNEPICYMQSPDGRTIDLSLLCEKTPKSSLSLTTLLPEEQLPSEEWRGSNWLNMDSLGSYKKNS
jgi:hypothetical protein